MCLEIYCKKLSHMVIDLHLQSRDPGTGLIQSGSAGLRTRRANGISSSVNDSRLKPERADVSVLFQRQKKN